VAQADGFGTGFQNALEAVVEDLATCDCVSSPTCPKQ
jgi:hypothetical protein